MRQIYNFEQHDPPVLNENMLRREAERRRTRWQTVLLAIAGLLLQVFFALLGYEALDWYSWLTCICFGYVIAATTGGGVVAIVYSRKGGCVV